LFYVVDQTKRNDLNRETMMELHENHVTAPGRNKNCHGTISSKVTLSDADQLVQRHKANQQRGYQNDRESCQSDICDFRTTHAPRAS